MDSGYSSFISPQLTKKLMISLPIIGILALLNVLGF